MLVVVLPTKMRSEVSFWTFFQISRQPRRIRNNQDNLKILSLSVVNLNYTFFPF